MGCAHAKQELYPLNRIPSPATLIYMFARNGLVRKYDGGIPVATGRPHARPTVVEGGAQ